MPMKASAPSSRSAIQPGKTADETYCACRRPRPYVARVCGRAARRLQTRLRQILQGHAAGRQPDARLPEQAARPTLRRLQESHRRATKVNHAITIERVAGSSRDSLDLFAAQDRRLESAGAALRRSTTDFLPFRAHPAHWPDAHSEAAVRSRAGPRSGS